MLRMYDIIHKKRCGEALTDEEIRFFVEGYTRGEIPDYQASALCMAICFCGMSDRETAVLTQAMMRSGDTIDLSQFGERSVDKHSTGGVGDKTTLIVVPIVAALGGKVAKMSGRGLGHTGGTVDKLESIVGYRTSLSAAEFLDIVERVGVCVIGQSASLAPADKKLYALRDVTATVESLPLIASSIMSKKLAAGAHAIVLDVKAGSGAFMKTPGDAALLAETMVRVGEACGRRVRALVTNMDLPLGYAVGNALEVKEAVRVLRGEQAGDLRELCSALAANMVAMAHRLPLTEAEKRVEEVISSGAAFSKMKEWVTAQGGDAAMLEDTSRLPSAPCRRMLTADRSGWIARMDTERVGLTASLLGAGRIRKEDAIDFGAGIELCAKTGDYVECDQPLAVLHTSDEARFADAEAMLRSALTMSDTAVERPALILGRVGAEN